MNERNMHMPRMQIVIPMSGFGERFRRVGYTVPKPLIEIEGKPIIAHVIDMFPGEHDFLFICNNDHLSNPEYRMEAILQQYCPSGRIVGIPAHKLGPIHAVQQVEHMIDMERPVVVNYCDFTCFWDWQHFQRFVQETGCAGSIPAYKGFTPHTLGHTMYCYMRESNGWVTDIQEKKAYTDNRMEEYASSGTYYFASGQIMSTAFEAAVTQQLALGGEYYVSLAYIPMLAANQSITVYPLQHFMQWGTPEDVAEYNGWSAAFKRLTVAQTDSANVQGSLVIPMAGLGQRFVNEGYTITKPLLPVSGKAMVVQATDDLPKAAHHVFVLRADMPGYREIATELTSRYPGAVIETISGVTEGQACSALLGLNALQRVLANDSHLPNTDVPGPITIGACDNGALYNLTAFQQLIDDPDTDVIVWGARGYANAIRHPQISGWIDAENGKVKRIAVKEALSSPATDPVVIGTFTFKKASDFRRAVDRLMTRNGRVNGEFYIDACINDAIELGLRCAFFEVDHYLCWGTPNDLRTFEYWQSCFHKWPGHPYRMQDDQRLPSTAIAALEKRYAVMVPGMPGPHP